MGVRSDLNQQFWWGSTALRTAKVDLLGNLGKIEAELSRVCVSREGDS